MNSQKRIASWSPTVMRVALGGIILVHGLGKLLGIGPAASSVSGFAGFLASLGVPFPELMAWVVTLVETVGALMIIMGLFTRYAAVLVAIDMAAATWLVHIPVGFAPNDGGFAYTLLLGLVAIGLVLSGPGRLALDHAIFGREMFPGMRRRHEDDEVRAKRA